MHRTPTHQDLIDLALGRLDPPRREGVERALREDPRLRQQARSIADHLSLYDALPASPPPPPFSEIEERLPSSARAGRRIPSGSRRSDWAVAAGGALAVLLIVVFVWGIRSTPDDPVGRAGIGVQVVREGRNPNDVRVRPGDVLEADHPAEVWLGDRVRVVMDEGARVEIARVEQVRLLAGRAYFEVAPGPFRVATRAGDVEVLGTVFEVAVSGDGLTVGVEEGRVRVAGETIEAGHAFDAGIVSALEGEVGTWFRRPLLVLFDPGGHRTGAPVSLDLILHNPGMLPVDVAAPEDAQAALWLTVVDPDGATHDLPLETSGPSPWPDAVPGRPSNRGEIRLGAREERRTSIRLGEPFGQAGVYRCRAMYRPRGQPPVVSPLLQIEVR